LPLAARAQQQAMPAIGFFDPRSLDAMRVPLKRISAGLRDAGYVEGDNPTII
jgi:putative tryptophan/tyrosine transport system substrate-binding protein